jgi:hypothetical protein
MRAGKLTTLSPSSFSSPSIKLYQKTPQGIVDLAFTFSGSEQEHPDRSVDR